MRQMRHSTRTHEMKQNRTSTQLNKARVLKALRLTLGVIQPACKMAKIGRQTFYSWKRTDPEFREDYQEIKEESLDFAEVVLLQLIAEGNAKATIFYLNAKGKHRGWGLPVSRRAKNVQQNYVNELENMSNEELMSIINGK